MRGGARRRLLRGAATGVIVSATLVALTGCVGATPSPDRSTVTPSVSPPSTQTPPSTPTAVPTAAVDALIESEGHVSATGTRDAVRIGVAPDDDQFRISIDGYRPVAAAPRRLILTTVASGADCGTALNVDTGTLAATSTQTLARPYPWANTYEDLSMLKFAVLVPTQRSWQKACAAGDDTVMPLTWSVPTRLGALTVVDHGRRYGAHGRVVVRAGRPLRYVVAPGDLLNDVATRFGLTPDEFLWLTPSRARGQDGLLYTGEQLNLDPAFRGLRT